MIIKLILLLMAALILTGCSVGQIMDGPDMVRTPEYTQIDQKTANEMMTQDDGHIIVDVRRQDEYDTGHIPGAICIPNESIGYKFGIHSPHSVYTGKILHDYHCYKQLLSVYLVAFPRILDILHKRKELREEVFDHRQKAKESI